MRYGNLVFVVTIITLFNVIIEAKHGNRVKRQDIPCVPETRNAACQVTYTRRGYSYGFISISQREGCGHKGLLTVTVGNIEPGHYAIYIGDRLTCADNTEEGKKIAEFTAVNRIWGVHQVETTLKSIFDVRGQRVSLVQISATQPEKTDAYACGKFTTVF